jgi:hypothetical protein
MRNDRIFVLLLVFLLPMSGCLENGIGEAEAEEVDSSSTENMLPVIYGSISLTASCPTPGASCSTNEWIYPVLAGNTMVIDYDGNVTNFGVDVDLDAEIDYEMGGNYSEYDVRVNFDFNESDIIPILWDPAGQSSNDPDAYCYQWINVIAVDDDGGKTIHPSMWRFDWDTESQTCDTSFRWG